MHESKLTFQELATNLLSKKTIEEIAELQPVLYIPYIDEHVSKQRGLYAINVEEGIALLPIEVTGVEPTSLTLLTDEKQVFFQEQMNLGIKRAEQLTCFLHQLNEYFQGTRKMEDLSSEIDDEIIFLVSTTGPIEFLDEKGNTIFPNRHIYQNYQNLWQEELNVLTEGISNIKKLKYK